MARDGVDEAVEELVGDRLVDHEPLGADAQLAGGGEARRARRPDGAAQVGVVGDVEAVLAAELEAGADEPPPGGLGDRRPVAVDPVKHT